MMYTYIWVCLCYISAGYKYVSTEPICSPSVSLKVVVGQSQPSVGWEGPNRVRWPISNKSVLTKKPIFLTYVSLTSYSNTSPTAESSLHTMSREKVDGKSIASCHSWASQVRGFVNKLKGIIQ